MGHFHEDGTYCDHDHDDAENIITLEFDDGENIECEALGIFEVDGKDYAALVPIDEELEDVYLYEYKEVGDEFELIDIEDDVEFEKVVTEFENILEEMEALDEEEKED